MTVVSSKFDIDKTLSEICSFSILHDYQRRANELYPNRSRQVSSVYLAEEQTGRRKIPKSISATGLIAQTPTCGAEKARLHRLLLRELAKIDQGMKHL